MKSKLRKCLRSVGRYLRQCSFILVVLLVGCAAVQPALPAVQNSGAVITTVVTARELATGMQQDETFIMFCARTNTYLVSYLTETGRVFVFYTARTFMPRGLMVGFDRTAGMIQQFVKDGWEYSAVSTTALKALMSLPMPTIMIFPVLPSMNIDGFMHQNDITD